MNTKAPPSFASLGCQEATVLCLYDEIALNGATCGLNSRPLQHDATQLCEYSLLARWICEKLHCPDYNNKVGVFSILVYINKHKRWTGSLALLLFPKRMWITIVDVYCCYSEYTVSQSVIWIFSYLHEYIFSNPAKSCPFLQLYVLMVENCFQPIIC